MEETVVAAEGKALPLRRRRRISWAPYGLVSPVVVAIGLILGYRAYKLVRLSFEKYGLFELIAKKGQWVGLKNYGSVLHDNVFWDAAVRTVVFTIANVGLTIVLGTLIALLLVRIGPIVRTLLLSGLVLVWAMPVVVAVPVFFWRAKFENGVLPYVLAQLHLTKPNHDWYGTTLSSLSMVTLLIVWGALPFVVVSV